jgi:hypothetical protein
MAGGMDWFRWHHGSVTDPKFALVAKRSGASTAEVIAVWACLLEAASMAEVRGTAGELDCEALELTLGLADGLMFKIVEAMRARALLDGDSCHIKAWEKRQPKRERDDNTAAERKQRQRDKETAGVTAAVTPSHATSHQDQPRGEEKRGEVNTGAIAPVGKADVPACRTEEVVNAYHEALAELPRVKLMNDSRRKAINKFWRWALTSTRTDGSRRATTADEATDWLKNYFKRAGDNDFLMGRGSKASGHESWRCNFDFLLTEKGKKHVIENTREAA